MGEGSTANELIGMNVHQINIEVVGPLRVGHAKVQAQLLMLKWKRQRLEVRENADQGAFLGEAVFNHAVAYQEGLHTRRRNVIHAVWLSSAEYRRAAARLEDITEECMSGAHATEVRSDFDELSAV